MKDHMRSSEERLKPYTIEELHARIDQSERDIAEGRVYDFDDVMRELEEEFAREDGRGRGYITLSLQPEWGLFYVILEERRAIYLFPFVLLWVLQSIWQFSKQLSPAEGH